MSNSLKYNIKYIVLQICAFHYDKTKVHNATIVVDM